MPANPRAASIRLKAAGRATVLAVQHDMRSGHIPAHVEASSTAQNSVLLAPPSFGEIARLASRRFEAAQRRRQAAGQKRRPARRSTASPAYLAIITFGAEAQEFLARLDRPAQDAALKAALEAAADYLDVPLLWASVHRDETAVHLHAGLCAVQSDGYALGTGLGGYAGEERRNTSQLQDVLHQALKPHLPQLERGARLIDRLKAGERPERARPHHQLRQDLGLPPAAQRNDVAAAVQELRKAQTDAAAVRREIAELEVRRNRLPHFNAALDEIEAGRLRPLEARRQWEVTTETKATQGIKDCRFTKPEWQALLDWQGAHDRQRVARQAAAEAEKTRDAAQTRTREAQLEAVAHEEILLGNARPEEKLGAWSQGPACPADRWPELEARLSSRKWLPGVWARLRRTAARITRTVEDTITALTRRNSDAAELAQKAVQDLATGPAQDWALKIAAQLQPPPRDHLALHTAARQGNIAEITRLLAEGADPNARDKHGATPLHRAAASANPEIVTILIDALADLHARDEHGNTPLHRAAGQNRDPEVIAVLIEAGAELEARDKQGYTPLHHAASLNDDPAPTARLLHIDADPEALSKFDRTPLHMAAGWGKPAVIRALLKAAAELEARDKDGQTPLALARHEGNTAAISALEDAARPPADRQAAAAPDPQPDTRDRGPSVEP